MEEAKRRHAAFEDLAKEILSGKGSGPNPYLLRDSFLMVFPEFDLHVGQGLFTIWSSSLEEAVGKKDKRRVKWLSEFMKKWMTIFPGDLSPEDRGALLGLSKKYFSSRKTNEFKLIFWQSYQKQQEQQQQATSLLALKGLNASAPSLAHKNISHSSSSINSARTAYLSSSKQMTFKDRSTLGRSGGRIVGEAIDTDTSATSTTSTTPTPREENLANSDTPSTPEEKKGVIGSLRKKRDRRRTRAIEMELALLGGSFCESPEDTQRVLGGSVRVSPSPREYDEPSDPFSPRKLTKQRKHLTATVNLKDMTAFLNFKFVECDPYSLAVELSNIEAALFRAIQPREFLRQAFEKEGKDKNAPHIMKMIDRFNEVSCWVATEVLKQNDPQKQALAIRKFMKVAEILRSKLNNFNGFMEIMSGLEMHPIQRLKNIWALLPAKAIHKKQKMEEFMSPDGNFKKYRDLLNEAKPPKIPYLAVLLKDFTFLNEGNARYDSAGGINLKRIGMLYRQIETIMRLQLKCGYKTKKKVPGLAEYLSHLESIRDEKELYRKSLSHQAVTSLNEARLKGAEEGLTMEDILKGMMKGEDGGEETDGSESASPELGGSGKVGVLENGPSSRDHVKNNENEKDTEKNNEKEETPVELKHKDSVVRKKNGLNHSNPESKSPRTGDGEQVIKKKKLKEVKEKKKREKGKEKREQDPEKDKTQVEASEKKKKRRSWLHRSSTVEKEGL